MKKHLCLISALLLLAGCSGGGGDAPQTQLPDKPLEKPIPDLGTAEGLWAGSTDTGWTRETTVLDDGTYYTLYSAPSMGLSGMIQGTGVSENGVFTSANARDFNFGDKRVLDATIAATYTERQRLSGSTTYPGLGTVGFTDGMYVSSYDLEPSMPDQGLFYYGSVVDTDGQHPFTVVTITGSALHMTMEWGLPGPGVPGVSSCSFHGTITPRAHGNVFDVSMAALDYENFPSCPYGARTLIGIAYFVAPGKLTVLVTTNDRANALVFRGNNQN